MRPIQSYPILSVNAQALNGLCLIPAPNPLAPRLPITFRWLYLYSYGDAFACSCITRAILILINYYLQISTLKGAPIARVPKHKNFNH